MSAACEPFGLLTIPGAPLRGPLAAACLATAATLLVLPYLVARPDAARVRLTGDVHTAVLPPPAPPLPVRTAEAPPRTPAPLSRPTAAAAVRLPLQPVFDLRLNLPAGAGVLPARFDIRADPLVTGLDAGVFELSEIDEAPQPIVRLKPLYPAVARMRALEGFVVLEFTVGDDGATHDVAVLESDPPGIFDTAATRAVARWRFRPGHRQGAPVAVRVRQRVAFALEE